MALMIASLYEVVEILQNFPNIYRVVSISSPNSSSQSERKDIIKNNAIEVLFLEFDDLQIDIMGSESNFKFKMPTIEDCSKALEFLRKGGNCIIHCMSGVSRSTGVGLGYLLEEYSTYEEAVDKLFEIRPCAYPNYIVVKLMCELLKMENKYQDIIDYIKCKRYRF